MIQELGIFFEWKSGRGGLAPEIWSQVSVSLGQSVEGGLQRVFLGLGVTSGADVHVFDTSHLKNFRWCWGRDDAGTSWSWDQSDTDGTTLALHLHWDGVWLSDLVTPVPSTDWDDVQLRDDDTSFDGGLDFLRALHTDTDVTVSVTDDDDGLESGSLTGLCLFLDWSDLHRFFLQVFSQEVGDDFAFFDWDGVVEDVFEGLDLAGFDQSSEFGAWDPFTFTVASSSWATFFTLATSSLTEA